MNNFISLVPIRAGSKGLKNKNIAKIQGVPLYLRTVNQALRITEKCIINTDINSILKKKNFDKNIVLFKRDKKFAEDNTHINSVLIDLFINMNIINIVVVLLQATSPLRKDEDIKNAINIFNKGKYSMVISVRRVKSNVLKYGYENNERFKPISKKYLYKNRQSLPKVFAPNGAIYIFSVNEFLKKNKLPENNIGFYEMPYERSIDIDKKEDLNKIRRIIRNDKK